MSILISIFENKLPNAPWWGVKQAGHMLHGAVKKDIDFLVSGLTFVFMKLIHAKLQVSNLSPISQ